MTKKTHIGIIMDDQNSITLEELMQACSCDNDWITDLANEGILEPIGEEKEQWCFSYISLHRALSAKRLQQDLGINIAGVALALELINEVDELKAQIKRLDM
jgi:chaperone modulatory protein CbpM